MKAGAAAVRIGPLAAIVAALAVGPARADSPSADGPRDGVRVDAAALEVDRSLDRVVRELTTTDAELERIRTSSDLTHRRMLARGRAWYRLSHDGLLPMGAGFDAMLLHSTRAERLRRAIERDIAEARDLDQRRIALVERRQKLLARKTPLEMQQKAMVQARAVLLEADDRTRAFARAFQSSVGADYMAVYGSAAANAGPAAAPDDSADTLSASFRAMKGRMPFPLAGRAEIRSVNRAGAGGPGIEMRAPAGTPVRSVFAGRVAFADEYANYGRVVIIDHGEHYFTVSGNLGTIEVKVGDDVGAGNRVGTVGTVQGRGLLYFELRHGGETLDPGPWLGL
jgi:murein hydrolase activator